MFADSTLPFPRREDTMSLDVIHPKDVPNGHFYPQKTSDPSLTTSDIEKCQPYYRHKFFTDKENYPLNMQKPPVEAAQRSRTYYPNPLRKPRDLSLTIADIEGARPSKTVVFKGNRHVDPLAPVYKVAVSGVETAPLSPRRFSKRPTNYIDDIEYSKPKIVIPNRNYVRDLNSAADIAYTCPNYRRRVLRPLDPNGETSNGPITLSVKGIESEYKIPFRSTNPIDPEYLVSQAPISSLHANWNEENALNKESSKFHNTYNVNYETRPAKIGAVPGSKPRKLQWSNGEPQFSLVTQDIAGTAPQRFCGERKIHVYDSMETQPPISFHDTFDIAGAQVSTLKKGIVTQRNTNPIRPNYTLLDGRVEGVADKDQSIGNQTTYGKMQTTKGPFDDLHKGGEAMNMGRSGAPSRIGLATR